VEDVEALERGVLRSLPLEHRFLILTDVPKEIDRGVFMGDYQVQDLPHRWPGWWSKIDLFNLEGPVLYFDLDTIVLGDIAQLARAVEALPSGRMMMLRGFYRQDRCSGILGWTGNWRWLVDDFLAAELIPSSARPGWTVKDRGGRCHGDQEWIAARMTDVVFAQDLAPGIVSYKVDVRPSGALPKGTTIVCFHGQPKPRDVVPAPPWIDQSRKRG